MSSEATAEPRAGNAIFGADPAGPGGFAAARAAAGASISGAAFAVASYPRSGNKMMRTLLRAYAERAQADLKDLPEDAPARQAFQAATLAVAVTPRGDVVSSVAGARELSEIALFGRRFVLAKTHAPTWPSACVLTPFFRLHMVRHPMDVLASGLNFLHLRGVAVDGAVPPPLRKLIRTGAIAAHVDAFIEARGAPHYAPAFGSWLDHALAAPESGAGSLTLRFEDVAADPVGEAARIFDALDAAFDPEIARAALRPADSVRYIELGRGGNYLADVLTDTQRARARDAFAPALERFGYEI